MNDGLGFNFAIEINSSLSDSNVQKYIDKANQKFSFDFGVNVDLKELSGVAERLKKFNKDIDAPEIAPDTSKLVQVYKDVEKTIQKTVTNMDDMGNVTSKTITSLLKNGNIIKEVFNADDTIRTQSLISDEVKKQNELLSLQKNAKQELISKEKELGDLAQRYEKSKGDTEKGEVYTLALEKSLAFEKQMEEYKRQGLITEEAEIELLQTRQKIQEKLRILEAQQIDKQISATEKQQKQDEETLKLAQSELEYQQKILEIKLKKVTGGKNADFIENPERIKAVTKAMEQLDGATKKEIAEKARLIGKEIDSIGTDANNKRIQDLGTSVGGMGFSFKDLGIAVSGAMVIREFYQQLRLGLKDVIAMNDAMTTLTMTMNNMSEAQIDKLIKTSQQMAKDLSANVNSVLESVKTVANANETMESIMAKSKPAVVLSNITGLDTKVTVDAIQGAIKSFDDLAEGTEEDAMRVADAMVSISKSLSMNFEDGISGMASSLATVGSFANQIGLDVETTIATISTVAEATRLSFDEVSSGLRNVMARVMRIADVDNGIDETSMLKAEKALSSIGVTIRGVGGEMRSFDDIMADVAGKWDTLTKQEQQYVADGIAGGQRINQAIALISEYGRVQELTALAVNGTGSAMEAQGIWSESLSAKIQGLTSSVSVFWQTFVNSDGFSTGVIMLTDLINGITTLVDQFGSATIAIPVLSMVMLGLTKNGRWLTKELVTGGFAMKKLSADATVASVGVNAMGTASAWATLKVGLLQAVLTGGLSLALSLVIGGISSLASGFGDASKKADELAQSVNKASNSIKESQSEISRTNELVNDYENLKKAIDENKISSDELESSKKELYAIEKQLHDLIPESAVGYDEHGNAVGIDTEYIKQNTKAKEEALAVEKELLKTEALANMRQVENQLENRTESRDKNQASLDIYKNKLMDAQQKNDLTLIPQLETVVNNLVESIRKENEEIASLTDTKNLYNSVLNETTDVIEKNTEAVEKNNGAMSENVARTSEEIAEANRKANESYVDLGKNINTAKELLKDISKNGMTIEGAEKLLSTFKDFTGNITDAGSAQEFLNEKISEMVEEQGVAYSEMISNDEEFWNTKIKNAQTWKDFVNDSNQSVKDFGSQILGEESKEFSDYIDKKFADRQVDLKNAKTLADAEKIVAQGLTGDLSSYFAKLVNDKGGYRNTDMKNVVDFLNTQGVKEASTVQELSSMWAKFYKAKQEAINREISSLNKSLQKVTNSNLTMDSLEGFEQAVGNSGLKNQMNKIEGLVGSIESVNNLFESIDTSFKGVSNALNQTLTNGGLGSSSSGSGGKDSSKKEVTNLENIIDRYYKLNDALTDVNNALELNKIKQEKATDINERKKLMDEEVRLLKEKRQALVDIQNEYKKEASEQRKVLENNGFKFDSDGNLKNYAERLSQLQKQANSLNGTAKESAIESVKAIMSVIESYTDLMNNSIPSVQQTLESLKFEMEDIYETHKKLLEAVERLGDRYYDVANAVSKLDNELALNQAKQENATTEERVALMERELELLKQKQQALQNVANEQRKEAEELRKALEYSGLYFDQNGEIYNYSDRLSEFEKRASALTGSARDEYLEYVNDVISKAEQYTEIILGSLPQLDLEWQEINNTIQQTIKEHEELKKKVDSLIDAYFELNNEMKRVDNELSLIGALKENATAEERLELMKKELELMQEKQKLTEELHKKQMQESEDLKKQLSESGVGFDSNGLVTNYEEVMRSLEELASSKVGIEREAIMQQIDELAKQIQDYTNLVNSEIPSTEQSWIDINNAIKDAQKEQLKFIEDMQNKISNVISNKLKERTEKIKKEINEQKKLFNDQFETEEFEDKLSEEQRKLAEIQAQMDNLSRDQSLQGKLKLEQLKKEYEEQQKIINDLIQQSEKDKGNQAFDDALANADKELEEALKPENISDLVNQALVDGFVTIGGEVIELNTLMTDWLDSTSEGLFAMGSLLKTELIDNLKIASELWGSLSSLTRGINMNVPQLNAVGSQPLSVAFNSPILSIDNVEGDIGENFMSIMNQFAKSIETGIVNKISTAMGTK